MPTHSSERIIDRHELRRLVPYSDIHVLRLERSGRFPQRVRLGPHRVGWVLAEVLDWIAQRKSERLLETTPIPAKAEPDPSPRVGRPMRSRGRA